MEEKRQKETSETRKYYQGLPVTSIAIIFPLLYLMRPYFGNAVYLRVLIGVMVIVAILFVSNIKVYKPGNKMVAALIGLGILILAKLMRMY